MRKPLLIIFVAVVVTGCTEEPAETRVASEPIDGQGVYEDHCANCHDDARNGAPGLGDQAMWASRVPEWGALLKDHATQGFVEMEPMGGTMVLSEKAVGAAVDYMLAQIKPSNATGIVENLVDGREIYSVQCASCHDSGDGGAPRLGDDAAWASRSPFWESVLDGHVEDGFLAMPAKTELGREEIKRAVDYMVSWESVP